MSGTKTWRAAYDANGRDTSRSRKREPKVQYKYSKEIEHIWISSMPKNSVQIRPKYTVCDTPTADKLRRNKYASGDRLLRYHQGPRMSSRDQAMACALDYLFDRSDVTDKICDIVIRECYLKPISLKSLWYIYRNEISNIRNYDVTICEQLFHNPYNPDCLLDNFIVGESSYAQIIDAIRRYCEDNGVHKAFDSIIAQTSILWDVGIKKMHTAVNSLYENHKEHIGPGYKQVQRNALVIGSHSEQSTGTLITKLMDNSTDPSSLTGTAERSGDISS